MPDNKDKAGETGSSEQQNGDPFWKKIVTLIFALVAVVIAGLLLWTALSPPPVAADFTRVGGANRTETAAAAATFWLSPPKRYYEVAPKADAGTVLRAADCAMRDNAPLLFVPLDGTIPPVEKQLTSHWAGAVPVPVDTQTVPCPGNLPGGMHTLTSNGRALPGGREIGVNFAIHPRADLASFVIFAASVSSSDTRSPPSPKARRETRDLPDVAVGMALAAHIASGPNARHVSLVVIPSYLEANPGLEESLRDQDQAVNGGIVLGGDARVPDDTVVLLRHILRGRDWAGPLGAVQGTITDTGALIAALAALLLGGAGVKNSAPRVIEEIRSHMGDSSTKGTKPVKPPEPPPGNGAPTGNGDQDAGHVQTTEAGRTQAYEPVTGTRSDRPTPFARGNRGDPRVTLYLKTGGVIEGIYDGEETLAGVEVIKLTSVDISPGAAWGPPEPDAGLSSKADVTLVAATDVVLAVRYPAPGEADTEDPEHAVGDVLPRPEGKSTGE